MTVEPELIERCRLLSIDEDPGWYVDQFGTTRGNRTKFVGINFRPGGPPIDGQTLWFWKESLPRYPIEFWSEVLAYHIGTALNLPVPPCFPAFFQGRLGALSQNMVNIMDGEALVHGGDLLLAVKPNYERKRGSDHSVQLIRKAFELFDLKRFQPGLFKQFILDGLIGNGDRHQDNWGLIARRIENQPARREFELCPAFDNGSSLARELTESAVDKYLKNESRLAAYVAKGPAHVRWETEGNLIRVNHEQLIRRYLEAWPRRASEVHAVLSYDDQPVERAIRRVCTLSRTCRGLELSESREELLVRLMRVRRSRLLEIVEEINP